MSATESFAQDYTAADFSLRDGELWTLIITHNLNKLCPVLSIHDENDNDISSSLQSFITNIDLNTIEMRFQTMPTIDVWHIRVMA